jgi:hypothetical protein
MPVSYTRPKATRDRRHQVPVEWFGHVQRRRCAKRERGTTCPRRENFVTGTTSPNQQQKTVVLLCTTPEQSTHPSTFPASLGTLSVQY